MPEDVYLNTESQRVKIDQHDGRYSYTFEKIQTPFSFQIEAAGFYSERYSVSLNNRPEINNLSIQLEYPKYLSKKNEILTNSGNLLIPEGTVVQWTLSTAFTDRATIIFTSDSLENAMQLVDNQSVIFKRAMRSSDSYVINLSNASGSNQDKIQYHIEIVKDLFPSITVNNLKDSVLYQRIMLGGIIGDDYGLTRLTLNYSIHNDELGTDRSGSISLDVSNLLQQSFYYNWSLDSLKLKADEKLEYYLEVWDNDGVNGRKSSRSARYIFNVPSTQDLIGEIKKSERQSEQHLQESRQKSNKLQEQIEDANQKLKGKQTLNWQDKKMLEDILREKERLQESIDQLKEENSLLNQKKELFTEQDERIKQKAEQIQKLMNELLDEETKKLFEELQRMLKENTDVNDMQKLMNKLNNNTQNLEKELERTLSLFKELQFDFKLDQSIKSLEEHIEQQKDLLDKTEKLENDKIQNEEERKHQSESLAKEQEELKNEVNETGKEIEELEKLGEELHNETGLDENENTDSIEQDQENSEEQLNENQPGKAKSPQKKSIEKMKQMAQKMQAAQSSMEMEMSEANLESLRQIVHGLVKLSYDEEQLLREFGELSQIDPRFNVIAQRQLKVKDDIKVIEDSLMALGSRDPFMGSVITKKVGELNNHLDNVVEANKERRRPQASSEMQATMASINDLALILDNHYEMMMQMMAKGGAGKPKKGSKKGPKLSEMQQQLNEKIKELKGSGKSGRQLSEELAEMAAEQERIRKALQEMEKKMKDGKLPGDLDGKMEQTETDLVNKQLTDQLIKRQQEILTRLLESEKSMREQDMEEERKGETAKDYQKEIPKAFEDYLRLKEKEVELLKTVPPKLYPYYKKEVGEYFKRMAKP